MTAKEIGIFQRIKVQLDQERKRIGKFGHYSQAIKKRVKQEADLITSEDKISNIALILDITQVTAGTWVNDSFAKNRAKEKGYTSQEAYENTLDYNKTGAKWGTGYVVDLRTKALTVKMIIENDLSVADASKMTGKVPQTIHAWVKKYEVTYPIYLDTQMGVVWAMAEEKWLFSDEMDAHMNASVEHNEEMQRVAEETQAAADQAKANVKKSQEIMKDRKRAFFKNKANENKDNT